MEKMKKIARGLDVFCRVLFWAVVVFGGLVLIGTALLLLLNRNGVSGWLSGGRLTIGGGISVTLPSEGLALGEFWGIWLAAALAFSLGAAVLCCALWTVRGLLRPMKEGRPFEDGVSRRFRRLGWIVLVGGAVCAAIDLAAQHTVAAALAGLEGDGLQIAVEYRTDAAFLVIALLLFLLSYIFRYGEELQKLSDETL